MNHNKIIWVFGCSAAGKETFIRAIENNQVDITEFGFEKKDVFVVEESIEYIKQYDDDPIGDKREEIVDICNNLNKKLTNKYIFIKGQNIDLDKNLVNKLYEVSKIDTEIIFLHSDIKVIFERVKRKNWFTKEDNDIEIWYSHMVRTANKVLKNKSFKITSIDSENSYKVTKFPIY